MDKFVDKNCTGDGALIEERYKSLQNKTSSFYKIFNLHLPIKEEKEEEKRRKPPNF